MTPDQMRKLADRAEQREKPYPNPLDIAIALRGAADQIEEAIKDRDNALAISHQSHAQWERCDKALARFQSPADDEPFEDGA